MALNHTQCQRMQATAKDLLVNVICKQMLQTIDNMLHILWYSNTPSTMTQRLEHT